MEERVTYKEGDVVIFVSAVPPCANREYRGYGGGYGWVSRDMDELFGKVVTISWFNPTSGHLKLNECRYGYTYGVGCIEGLASKELQDKIKKERAEARAKIIKKHPKIVFTPEKVGALAIDVFGKKRVDVVKGVGDNFDVIIHFPEIELVNSKDQKHKIKDLYTKFSVSPQLDNFSEPEEFKADVILTGAKTSFTLKEWESGYVHSHLPSQNYEYSSFCLGSSAFRIVLSQCMEKLTEDAWNILFLSLPSYLKWESLEGGPHIKMGCLAYKNVVKEERLHEDLNRISVGIPKNVWETNAGGLSVIPTHPDLYKYFDEKSKIRKLSGYTKEEYNKRKKQESSEIFNTIKEAGLIWKGKKIKGKLLNENEPNNNILEKIVVDRYTQILNRKSKEFIKNKNYNDYRERNKEKVFGTLGTF